jgi:hypothetical protein
MNNMDHINLSRPETIETGDLQMNARILALLRRQRAIEAEIAELIREGKEISRELLERKNDALFAEKGTR